MTDIDKKNCYYDEKNRIEAYTDADDRNIRLLVRTIAVIDASDARALANALLKCADELDHLITSLKEGK